MVVFGFELFWTFAFVFATCECGHQVQDACEAINYEIVQLNWLRFSLDLKRILLIFIIDLQQPARMKVFGSFSCGRMEFKKVTTTFKILNEYVTII